MNDNNLMNLKHCFTLSILLIVTLFLSSCATNQSNQSIEPDIEPKEQMPVVIETKEPAAKEMEEQAKEVPKISKETQTITPNGGISQDDLKFDNPSATSDPFNDPQGPFYHQILRASSEDGLNFNKEEGIIFDKASVPDIIKLPNGRIIIYAVDGARRSKSGLMVATSDDNGKTWKQGSLQLKSPRQFASGADPEAVLLPDGRIRLYYVVFLAPQQHGVIDTQLKNRVHSALSSDGIYFEEEEGFRFEYPQITDPDIVNIGDEWFMYLAQGPRLIAASSSDGLSFKFEKIIREQGSVSNTVAITNTIWRQFFCVGDGIGSATTSDGANLDNDAGFRLKTADPSKIICDPAPIQIDSKWILFYKVSPLFRP